MIDVESEAHLSYESLFNPPTLPNFPTAISFQEAVRRAVFSVDTSFPFSSQQSKRSHLLNNIVVGGGNTKTKNFVPRL